MIDPNAATEIPTIIDPSSTSDSDSHEIDPRSAREYTNFMGSIIMGIPVLGSTIAPWGQSLWESG
jgi:hypothetical protein